MRKTYVQTRKEEVKIKDSKKRYIKNKYSQKKLLCKNR